MTEIIILNDNYSTTRRVVKADLDVIANEVKQSNKPEDEFETVLFLPEGEDRKGEGGLRTKGYFKVGGVISGSTLCHSEQSKEPPNLTLNTHHSTLGSKPLITVVTVVFNGEKFLEETIQSVINQTYDNVEYIIIDGGSADGTLDIIRKYEHAVDYWVSEKDKGIYDAMNKGIRLALGDIVGLINADDFYADGKVFSNLMKKKCNNYQIYYGDMLIIDQESKEVIEKRGTNLKKIYFGMYLNHPSILCSLNAYKKNGLFRSEIFSMAADYDFLLRCKKNGAIFFNLRSIVSIMRDGGVSIKNYKITQSETLSVRKDNLNRIEFLFSQIIKYLRKITK